MKIVTELYTCDKCKEEIEVGWSFKGGLCIVSKHKFHGGVMGGSDPIAYHYCSNCLWNTLLAAENDLKNQQDKE